MQTGISWCREKETEVPPPSQASRADLLGLRQVLPGRFAVVRKRIRPDRTPVRNNGGGLVYLGRLGFRCRVGPGVACRPPDLNQAGNAGERFDGILSAIDFSMDIQRVADPKGDRVNIVLNGKFLPYKTY